MPIVALILLGTVSFVAGALIGRWWALLLPIGLYIAIVAVLVASNNLESDQDTPSTIAIVSAVFFLPPAGGVAAVGILVRRRLQRRQRDLPRA
jgi:hypothetical protein